MIVVCRDCGVGAMAFRFGVKVKTIDPLRIPPRVSTTKSSKGWKDRTVSASSGGSPPGAPAW